MSAPATAEILPPDTGLAVYNQFRRELARFKDENAKTHFEYADPKGNREARSHVYKLRQSKAAVEKARQAEKAASLEYGRKVDAEAKEIIAEIEQMIEVHQKPLEEIEEKERDRVERVGRTLDDIRSAMAVPFGATALSIAATIDRVQGIVIDPDFRERTAEAEELKATTIATLGSHLDAARRREAADAELERMRREAAEREERERQDKAAREAEQEAARLAAEQAEKQKQEVARAAEIAAQAERDRAAQQERDRKAAAELAERRAAEAVQAERQRVKAEAEAQAAAEAKREANKKHQTKIHGEIIAAIKKQNWPLTEDQIKALIIAIRQGDIPHISISY